MALPLLRLPSSSHRHLPSPSFSSPFSSSSSSSSRASTFRHKERGLILLRHGKYSSSFVIRGSVKAAPPAVEEDAVQSPAEPRRRLIAQNIPWTCTAEDIRSLFEKHGTVVDVELSMHSSGRNRGLAFVTMSSEEEALAALNNLNSYDLDNRVIKVELARSLKKNPPPTKAPPLSGYNVFVGNLDWRVRSRDLRELFNGNGNILSAEVIYQSNPRKSAGYGFVSFASKEEAEAAITAMNGKRLMGRPIRMVLGKVQASNAVAKPHVDEQLDQASPEEDSDKEGTN